MQRNKTKDIIVSGFALFAIFFGAGNLIFPPYLGIMSGENWLESAAGFLITDPIFPVLGLIATAMVGGMADDLGKRISHKFAVAIGVVSILTIGPLFAVPRTAATTHEVFTVQVFGDGTITSVSPAITSVLFFAASLALVINPSKVIDIIGQFLTPVLLVILIGTIIIAIFNPVGEMAPAPGYTHGLSENLFVTGFSEGYQTMDALGAALMSGIVVSDLISKGYTEEKEQFKAAVGAGIVAAVLLALVYGGLVYVGATLSGIDVFANTYLPEGNRTAILVGLFEQMFGPIGKWAIGIAVTLACLTTSIGLTGIFGNFFTRIFHKEDDPKFYKILVTGGIAVSFVLSLAGVSKLIFFAVPILSAVYPIYMALFVITVFDKWIKYNWTYTGAILAIALVSLPKGINMFLGMNGIAVPGFLGSYIELLNKIPLAALDFNWILPGIVGMILGIAIQAIFKVGKTREDM